jgi:hypothetical protein
MSSNRGKNDSLRTHAKAAFELVCGSVRLCTSNSGWALRWICHEVPPIAREIEVAPFFPFQHSMETKRKGEPWSALLESGNRDSILQFRDGSVVRPVACWRCREGKLNLAVGRRSVPASLPADRGSYLCLYRVGNLFSDLSHSREVFDDKCVAVGRLLAHQLSFFLIRVGMLLVILTACYAWCRWGAAQWGFSPLILLVKRKLARTGPLRLPHLRLGPELQGADSPLAARNRAGRSGGFRT